MKSRILSLFVCLLLLFSVTGSVSAQANYSFQLSKEIVNVYLNKNGSISLDYQFTFINDNGAHVIDFVDLGLPNDYYEISSITAYVDGNPASVTTDYQGSGSGVGIALGNHSISNTGTVNVKVGTITHMYYPDQNDQNYTSSEFSPTFFGSSFVHGNTNMSVIFHLPTGVKPEEPRYHNAQSGWPGASEPKIGVDNDGRITYTWQSGDANGSTQYTFGASFPKTYIPAGAIITKSLGDYIDEFFTSIAGYLPFCCFGLFFFGIPALSAINDRKRKLQYIKPTISIEGHGIKRGLTAVEAAILMGLPLEKVMTMLLFSTIKKGALQVVKNEPLTVELISPTPLNLQTYENEFITAMVKVDRERRKSLQALIINLVKIVTEKMKGFNRKETLDYYKSINDKAWQQIEAAGTPEIKSQIFDESMEWTMLDHEYEDRTRRTFTGPVLMPMWWGRYDPFYRNTPGAGSFSQTSSTGPVSIPTNRTSLPGADFAASVVGGIQNVSAKVIGNVNDFTNGVTNVTNPVPKTSSSGGRSGGGCACACAGCACACAGGGR